MPVPTYEEFMLPIMRLAGDGAEHRFAEALNNVETQLSMTQEERAESLPSGQTKAYNRFCWAITYLQNAKLLDKTARGRFRITVRGREVLASNPARIDNGYLARFDEFLEFKRRKRPETVVPDKHIAIETSETPEERIEGAQQELRNALSAELLDRVQRSSPKFFEHLVVDLLVAMGYGGSRADAAQVVGRSGDGGIDGTIKEDKLGLDVVYIQAKRWEGSVGRKEVQSFTGSLEGERANKGVFITTSTFTDEAREYVKKIGKKIVLLDGAQLSQLMIDHGVGVSVVKQYSVQKIDGDYFEETE